MTAKVERERGTGRIFRPVKNGKELRFWRIAYWGVAPDGRWKELRESSRSTDRRVAEKMLRDRLRRVENHKAGLAQFTAPKRISATTTDILDGLIAGYELRGLASVRTTKAHVAHLKAFFGFDRADSITTDRIRAYIGARQREEAAPATIDRELEKLGAALRQAADERKLAFVPKFPPRLVAPHSNAREGFVEAATFRAVLEKIEDEDVRDFAEWLYLSGMRRGEALRLTWEALDRNGDEWTLRLPARSAKTKKPRLFALDGDFLSVIRRRISARRPDQPHIFFRLALRGRGEDSQRLGMGDFSKAWRAACKTAGVAELLLHDLRRSAIRNLIRAGVPQTVAMQISGHRTDATFRRYNISDSEDLRQAALAVTAYRDRKEREASKIRAIAG